MSRQGELQGGVSCWSLLLSVKTKTVRLPSPSPSPLGLLWSLPADMGN